MRFDNPELIDRLAAEYVLGTLRGAARKRFERVIHADFAAARRVRAWEKRLTPLAHSTRPLATSPRVWEGIEARIAGAAKPATAQATPERGITFWRRATIFMGTLASAMGIAVGVAATASNPSCYAVLTDAKSQPLAVIFDERNMKQLRVLPVGTGLTASGSTPYLWTISDGKVHGVGALKQDAQTKIMLSTESLDALMQPGVKLAVTAEPPGNVGTAPKGPKLVDGMLAMVPKK
jgi:anti-sigma-K factor RskA